MFFFNVEPYLFDTILSKYTSTCSVVTLSQQFWLETISYVCYLVNILAPVIFKKCPFRANRTDLKSPKRELSMYIYIILGGEFYKLYDKQFPSVQYDCSTLMEIDSCSTISYVEYTNL
jgi:hypothetical protein